ARGRAGTRLAASAPGHPGSQRSCQALGSTCPRAGPHLAMTRRVLRRPSIALAAALALWAGLAGGAEAQRVRARSAAPAARTARGTPAGSAARVARGTPAGAKARASRNLLGEGWFSRVYASRDGAYVVKQMKPQIGDVVPITPRRRAELARRT